MELERQENILIIGHQVGSMLGKICSKSHILSVRPSFVACEPSI